MGYLHRVSIHPHSAMRVNIDLFLTQVWCKRVGWKWLHSLKRVPNSLIAIKLHPKLSPAMMAKDSYPTTSCTKCPPKLTWCTAKSHQISVRQIRGRVFLALVAGNAMKQQTTVKRCAAAVVTTTKWSRSRQSVDASSSGAVALKLKVPWSHVIGAQNKRKFSRVNKAM